MSDSIMQQSCLTCGGITLGFKCEKCGMESKEPDQNHPCGGASFIPKCLACNEAESKCTCLASNTAGK